MSGVQAETFARGRIDTKPAHSGAGSGATVTAMAIDQPTESAGALAGDGSPADGETDLAALTGEQMTALLNGIPGALERARLGWAQVLAGDHVPISEL